jgi:hypothetical protein
MDDTRSVAIWSVRRRPEDEPLTFFRPLFRLLLVLAALAADRVRLDARPRGQEHPPEAPRPATTGRIGASGVDVRCAYRSPDEASRDGQLVAPLSAADG